MRNQPDIRRRLTVSGIRQKITIRPSLVRTYLIRRNDLPQLRGEYLQFKSVQISQSDVHVPQCTFSLFTFLMHRVLPVSPNNCATVFIHSGRNNRCTTVTV